MLKKYMTCLALIMTSHLHAEPVHWSYEGQTGPAHWGELSQDFVVCHKGQFQSPIDIRYPINANIAPLDITFNLDTDTIVNNGHTLQVTVDDADDFILDAQKFKLVQFHFHTPSENLIQGKSFPLEAHFVHQNAEGELAVVAVMFEVGAENPALKPVLANLPKEKNKPMEMDQKMDIKALFPADKHYYRFSGSLTTPPCTEGLRWLVMKKPVTLSANQLEQFQAALKFSNNRPTQPRHGRIIAE